MITLVRTNSQNHDFIASVKQLDADLAVRDGKDHAFFAQFNKIDKLNLVVIVYEKNRPPACGAIKAYNTSTMEVKRMYACEESRGRGMASRVLEELEKRALELAFEK